MQELDPEEAKRLLTQIDRHNPDVVLVISTEFDEILYVNSAYEEIWGRSIEDARADPTDLLDGIHPDDRSRVVDATARVADGEVVNLEYRVDPTDDYDRWVSSRSVPIYDGGDVARMASFVREITERKRHERAITSLHAAATELVESSCREDVYERTLDTAEDLLEFERSAIAIEEDGLLCVRAMSDDMPLEEMPTMTVEEGIAGATYRTGESFLIDDATDSEVANPQADIGSAISVPIGEYGVFQVIDARPEAFDDADVERAELLVRHTEGALDRLEHERERRRRMTELERKNERLEEFAGIVSHDLRNPLNVLAGSLELAEETGEREYFDDCRRSIERMEQLIDDLLALARQGERVDDAEPVELARIAERCWRTVETPGATLQVDANVTLMADPGRFRRLLENLFRNAVEHGGDDVTVTIGPLDGGGFYVADDGPGVPVEIRDRVFEAGFSTSRGGNGLGLSIVKRIAEDHGWAVDVVETDDGTRFEISGVETRKRAPERR